MKITYVYFVLLCLFVCTLIGIESREREFRHPDPQKQALQQTKQIFESTCAKCHGLEQIYKAQHSAQEWKALMARMAKYSGGTITAEQNEKIYKYLLKIKNLE